jgi:hypothetical protein
VLAYHQIVNAVEKLEFGWPLAVFGPWIKVHRSFLSSGASFEFGLREMPHRDTGERKYGVAGCVMYDHIPHEMFLYERLLDAFKTLLDHELRESVKIAGVRAFDPHLAVKKTAEFWTPDGMFRGTNQ